MTMHLVKRIELEAVRALEELTGTHEIRLEEVGPWQFHGIEVKAWAREIAELTLWIGFHQFWKAHHDVQPPEPILRDTGTLEHRDAVLAWDEVVHVPDKDRPDPTPRMVHPVTGKPVPDPEARLPYHEYRGARPAEWTQADFIVGNPPYLRNKRMREGFGDGYVKDPVEVEADHFAIELLLPERWARPVVDTLPVGMDAIRVLADEFGTSLSCAAVRYAQLSAAPVVVVLTRGDSIKWVAASREVRDADFFRYNATRTARVPQGSATRRLADNPAAVRAGAVTSSADFLCDWFPRAPRDLSVEVDAAGLGTYGRVLSLLLCEGLPEPDELYLQEQLGEEHGENELDWRSEMRRQAGYGDR